MILAYCLASERRLLAGPGGPFTLLALKAKVAMAGLSTGALVLERRTARLTP
jgi:hypothetical protein